MKPAETLPPPEERSGIVTVGEVLADRWETQLQMGRGPWGEVFLVQDRYDRLQYAAKVVSPEQLTAASRARLPELRQRLTDLAHPNLLQVVEAEALRDGALFVMQLVNGPNLGQWLAESGPLSVRDGLDAFHQILDGIQALHERREFGVALHPGNVLVDSGLLVTIGHLGLPELLLAAGQPLPHAGRGAWFYAPEWQHAGPQSADALRAADIYSASVFGYLLLAGKHPFPAGNPQAAWEIRQTQAAPLPSKSAPDLSPAFDAPLMKGLSLNPEDRFSTISDMREALFANVGPLGRHRSVLIVDDDPDFARYATTVLRVAFADATVTSASDPRAALRVIDRRPPSVVLLDLDMPEVNGLEVAAALRGSSNSCEVVVVTADDSPSNEAVAKALGVNTYIQKPVSPQALIDSITPFLT